MKDGRRNIYTDKSSKNKHTKHQEPVGQCPR